MLSSGYIGNLPKQKFEAAAKICEDFYSGILDDDPIDTAYTLEIILGDDAPEAQELTVSTLSLFGLKLAGRSIKLGTAKRRIEEIHRHVKALLIRDAIAGRSILPADQNQIEIDRSQIKYIETLLSEIREILRKSDSIDENHKLRLLKIVSDFQAEIDKPISSYRVFLNGMIETSEALGTSGEKVKPVFDRIREVFGIADKAKKMVEQLSAPEEIKQLPAPDTSDNTSAEPEE